MKSFLTRFAADENGAVTVDWVVLVAATVGLGLIVINLISPTVTDKSEYIADVIALETLEP